MRRQHQLEPGCRQPALDRWLDALDKVELPPEFAEQIRMMRGWWETGNRLRLLDAEWIERLYDDYCD